MNIYIDESGSFVSANKIGSWNAIAALAVPECGRSALAKAMTDLKKQSGRFGAREVKIHEITEQDFFDFVRKLVRADFLLFSIATDAGLNTIEGVSEHQAGQVAKIREPVDRMLFATGRAAVELVARQVENLPPQLYVQLFCQLQLMYDVFSGATNYFAQTSPPTLGAFRWRVDQKDAQRKSTFEDAFEKLVPAILQTISLRRPMITIHEFDYSAMKKYEFAPDERPTYLREVYGLDVDGGGWNLGKILRGDIKFVDSKDNIGVQAVDLLASGIRRCLRMGFNDNVQAARLLGALMLRPIDQRPDNSFRPMMLVSFGLEGEVGEGTDEIITTMRRYAKSPIRD